MRTDQTKESIIILAGKHAPAILTGNVYLECLSAQYDLIFIEERRKPKQTFQFYKRYLLKRGILRLLDIILMRIVFTCVNFPKRVIKDKIKKKYMLSLVVSDINSAPVRNLIRKTQPKYVIANGCWILNKETLDAASCPILNVHPGINPRYRGGGNFWAVYEKNFQMIGATLHFVDEGIDTGERISVVPIKLEEENFIIEEISSISHLRGAYLLVDYILHQKKNIPEEYQDLQSRYYELPGLKDYLKAKRNFINYRKANS